MFTLPGLLVENRYHYNCSKFFLIALVCECVYMSYSPKVIFYLFNFLFEAIGVSNQRETTVVWDKLTGEPLYNAVGKLSRTKIKFRDFFHLQMYSC